MPGGENGKPVHYSGLENSMDRMKAHGGHKSQMLQSPQAWIYFFSSSVSFVQSSEITLNSSVAFLKAFFFLHDENIKYQERK